jgi:SlyX protein
MSEARFEDLETQLAFQEDLIQKLDDALADQQQQIFDLKIQLQYVTDQIHAAEAPKQDDLPEPPPPHY